jgi:Holliday junction DNA helicase RuvA
MIAYIKGKITFKSPTDIHVETAAGVAYHVNISLLTYSQLEKLDDLKIYTQLIVKEDSHTLYGFMTEQEKNLFNKLLSVSGIGPNTSRVILSSMTPDEIVRAIAADDHVRFSKVKGIGPKTAKRVILDLKDKLTKEIAISDTNMVFQDNSARNEALSALTTLGFPKNRVEKTLSDILKNSADSMDSEALIKAVLKKMS